MDNSADWERPATVFLSYRRKDADDVKALQSELQVRGVRAWRDMTHLSIGSLTRDEIIRAITEECDAFLLYVTPESLVSDFIWNVEVPAVLHCWEQEHAFAIVPVLHGVSLNELRQCCASHGLADLTAFNAITFPVFDDGRDESVHIPLREIAQRILHAVLHLQLRRVRAERRTYEPSLCLHTSQYMSPIDHLDLDLNWTEFFIDGRSERWPSQQEWQDTLLPALYDVKDTLSALPHSRILRIAVHAPLPVAFALGFVLPRTARFTLVLENERWTWRSDEPLSGAGEPLTTRLFELNDGDRQVAVVELSISRPVTPAVNAQLPSLSIAPGYRLQLDIKGGAGLDSVRDGAHALAIAHQLGRELRSLCDLRGVRQLHLFFSAPVELAALMGHHLNATGTLHVYQYVRSQSRYIPGCVLHQ
jgi:SMODS-associated and fused to various effectors sensor domain/TIR domain